MPTKERHLVAGNCRGRLQVEEKTVYAFDEFGTKILDCSGRHDIIVMDELGFLESGAFCFQSAVMRRLDGEVPVVGVIKPCQSEFLDMVKAHPMVSVKEVTEANREDVLEWLLSVSY